MVVRRAGTLRGAVQGVGLRPFVVRLARDLGLAGFVRNDGDAVRVEVEGSADAVAAFEARVRTEGPPAARLDAMRFEDAVPRGETGFAIAASALEGPRALTIGPDRRVCADCAREVRDPTDRRHRYPFTSCTACGPRFTIVEALPFDRERTTMRAFPLCAACRAEYDDPRDRRAHAQTTACPACGPTLVLRDRDGALLAQGDEASARAIEALRRGAIVAMLGLGGYQLLCDARDEDVVARLRARKRRPAQPLAVLVADLDAARALAHVSEDEARLLADPSGAIVLLRGHAGARASTHTRGALARGVAPGIARIGLLLPTTPLHALVAEGAGFPLVCTSGNAHDEPIAIAPADAHARLASIADCFLEHDRVVAHRADDSVVMHAAGARRVLRLGRGLGPMPVALGGDGVARLAVGAQWKNAPVLTTGREAILFPHVGDLESPRARAAFADAVASMEALLGARPSALVCDAHPDYVPTAWAEARAAREGLPLVRVFHHHAHVASVLAEHGLEGALGFAWDGTGLAPGPSGSMRVAGGETLRVDARGARWRGHLRPFALPGGDAASRDGRRPLAAMLAACGLPLDGDLARFAALVGKPALAPATSSVGRLLDAAACLLGVCARASYEGQAPMELEAIADPHERRPYPFVLEPDGTIDWRPAFHALFADRGDAPRASARLHETLVAMVVAVCARERPKRVALSGGCFANVRLLEGAIAALSERGIDVRANARVPAGDGGIALGQAWIASRHPPPRHDAHEGPEEHGPASPSGTTCCARGAPDRG